MLRELIDVMAGEVVALHQTRPIGREGHIPADIAVIEVIHRFSIVYNAEIGADQMVTARTVLMAWG